jgi:triosephosphate isomerase
MTDPAKRMPANWGKRTMRQLIAGNWKMHGLSEQANALAAGLRMGADGLNCDLLVCPPFVHVQTVSYLLKGSVIAVGGQDCHAAAQGAHTGDISAPMLADLGASFVILGHSERRQNHGETDATVREKALAAVQAELTPIVCVGEIEADRIAGRETEVVGAQLAGSLPDGFAGVVAYEPVWAIGTGRTPTEADVAAMHEFIRAALVRQLGAAGQGLRILYGGSVKPSNAASLLAIPDVGGALVGGASLIAEDFLGIARAARPG